MLVSLDDYTERVVDPRAPFVAIESDELLDNVSLDPSLATPPELLGVVARAWTTNALRLQQQLVYRMGAQLGVLSPVVPKLLGMLQATPSVSAVDSATMLVQAIATAIGVASDALTIVPILGNIVKAGFIGADLGLRFAAALATPGTRIGKSLSAAQRYSTSSDATHVNEHLMSWAEGRDWTPIFMPAFRGKLAAQVREAKDDRLVIAWGLSDRGVVPRIVIDERPIFKPYTWHFSDDGGDEFTGTGGMGAVPGAPRIVTVTQCTVLEHQNIHRGHESLGDPRCGSARKTADLNVGLWYPNTANGAWSLYGYCTKPSPSTYTIDAQEVLHAWEGYVDAIWEGIDRLWRNTSWERGWGCGLWQNALQGLAASHCVGMDNVIGGFGAWMPTRYETKLTAADRDQWEANNLCTRIVKPAMYSLREMQLDLLRTTPMAAYLPRTGLGSFADKSVDEEFQRARAALLTSPDRSRRLLLPDVVDVPYLHLLKALGLGTSQGDGGVRDEDYRPPRLPMPDAAVPDDDEGGGGLLVAGLAVLGLGLAGYGLVRVLR